MKGLFFAGLLGLVAMMGWRIGGQLSSDALGMAVGIGFGVMAGIPAVLILLASWDRREIRERKPQTTALAERKLELPAAPAQTVNNFHVHHHYHGGQAEQPDAPERAQLPAPKYRVVE